MKLNRFFGIVYILLFLFFFIPLSLGYFEFDDNFENLNLSTSYFTFNANCGSSFETYQSFVNYTICGITGGWELKTLIGSNDLDPNSTQHLQSRSTGGSSTGWKYLSYNFTNFNNNLSSIPISELDISNGFNIQFDSKTGWVNSRSWDLDLYIVNDTQNDTMRIQLWHGGASGSIGVTTFSSDCNLPDISLDHAIMNNSQWQRWVLTDKQMILNNCTDTFSNKKLKGWAFIDTQTAGQAILDFDNLIINNNTNSLPSGNLSFNKNVLCVSPEVNSVTFNLSLDVYDSDNDQIYYAESFQTSTDISEEISFTRPIFLGFGQAPDYSFMDSVIKLSDSCGIAKDNKNISSIDNNFALLEYEDNSNPNAYWFSLKNCSESDKSLYYQLQKSTRNLNFLTSIVNTKNIGGVGNNSMNITVWDSQIETKIMQLMFKFNNTNSNWQTYIVNETGSFIVQNSTFNPNIMYFEFDLDNDFVRVFLTGNDQVSSNYSLYNSDSNNQLASIIQFSTTENMQTRFKYFIIDGLSSDLTFTTTKPTSFTVSNAGTYEYKLYVSDSYHYQTPEFITLRDTVSLIKEEICIDSQDFKGLDSEFIPQFNNEFLNGLLSFLRIPRRLIENLGLLDMWYIVVNVGLVWVFIRRYSVLTSRGTSQNYEVFHIPQNEVLKKLSIELFLWVFLLYFGMLLIQKTIFVIFSIFGLLYLGSELQNMFGSDGSDFNKTLLFGTAWFNLLSYIYFSFVQIATNINFGIPKFNTLFIGDLSIIQYLGSVLVYIWNLLFFTIPDIPLFISLILIFIKIISVMTAIMVIYNALLPTVEG